MNSGKLCISISAETGEGLIEKLVRASDMADLVEARFDGLEHGEADRVFTHLRSHPELARRLLMTYRSPEREKRLAFWRSAADIDAWGIDLEPDIFHEVACAAANRVCSDHSTDPEPDIDAIYARLRRAGATLLKIAAPANEAAGAISVWRVIERAMSDNVDIIPIAMGEAGKWTRILGLAHGAYLTYASLADGEETADGQISARDMLDVYRVKMLNRETEVYGVVAGDTNYSVSPWLHNAAFKNAEMNRVFVPFETRDLGDFIRRMIRGESREVELNIRGLSVTNPHKSEIIGHLDRIEPAAAKIGAVNTVKIEDDRLIGYNTDASGFMLPLKKVLGDLKRAHVGIAGAGGAARACAYALKQAGADVTIFARSRRKAEVLADQLGVKVARDNSFKLGSVDILVNATPLGTRGPTQDMAVARAEQMNGMKLVYDLVYNPMETRLVKEAKRAGVAAIGGLDMLIAQGRMQFEIWTGEQAPFAPMAAAVKARLSKKTGS